MELLLFKCEQTVISYNKKLLCCNALLDFCGRISLILSYALRQFLRQVRLRACTKKVSPSFKNSVKSLTQIMDFFSIRNKKFLFRRWLSTLNVVFGVGVGFRFRRDVGFGRKRNGTKPNVESSFGTTEDSSSSSSSEVIRPKVGADERAETFHRMTFSQRLA